MNDDDKNPMPAPGAEAASGGSADEAAQRSASDELYPRDCGTLSLPVRILLVTLLKGPYLYRDKRKEMWALLFLTLTVSSWGNPCSVWGCAPFFIVPNML